MVGKAATERAPPGRVSTASRALAAIAGGYAVAALAAVFLTVALPVPRAEAVQTGMLASILIWVVFWIWGFSVRRAATVWLGVAVSTAALAMASWLAGAGGWG